MKDPHIYELAIMSQDACNLSGLAHSLTDTVFPAIRAELTSGDWPEGTDSRNQHPVVFLIVFQMLFLASGSTPDDHGLWDKHYQYCKKIVAESKQPTNPAELV